MEQTAANVTVIGKSDERSLTDDEEHFLNEVRGLPVSVRKWLLGLTAKEPACLYKVMDQAANKINFSLALLIVNRLASVNRITQYMADVEEDLFSEKNQETMDIGAKLKLYKHFDKTLSDFLDFVRKFVGQNQDMFRQSQPADELAELLRSVDPFVLKKLVHILREKGASLTEDDIEGEIKKPLDPTLQELAK